MSNEKLLNNAVVETELSACNTLNEQDLAQGTGICPPADNHLNASPNQTGVKKGRISSIDTLKFFANFSIVFTHTQPHFTDLFRILNGTSLLLAYVVYDICRLALPIFFLSSGYFFARSFAKGKPIGSLFFRAFQKISFLFVIWTLVYFACKTNFTSLVKSAAEYGWLKSVYWRALHLGDDPLKLLLTGTNYHLWFLPALLIALTLTTLIVVAGKQRYLIYVVMVSYLLKLFLKPHVDEIFFMNVKYETLFGISKATAFVSLGWLIGQKKKIEKVLMSQLVSIGILLIVSQNIFAWVNNIGLVDQVLVGILPLSAGVMLWALQYPSWAKNWPMQMFGQYTLGIYCMHPLLLDLIRKLAEYWHPGMWNFIFPVMVYGSSLSLTLFLRRNSYAKALIS